MKQSRYNLIFEYKNKKYAFNAVTCALAEIKDDFLNALQNPQSISADDNSELVKNMKEANYIVEDDFDEVMYQKLLNYRGKFSGGSLGLVIAPTLNCNFACPYCFEGQAKNREHKVMSAQTCAAIYSLVENSAARKHNIDITWYGGEPLLAKDLIFEMSKKFINICRKNKVRYNAGIITNGYLIDDDIVKKMIETKITFAQVTIDGTEDIHNSRRKLKDNNIEGTFNKIVENVKKLVNKNIDISIRINVDKTNDKEIENLLKFLKKEGLGKCKINLGHVRAYTTACSDVTSNCFSMEEYAKTDLQFQQLMEKEKLDVNAYPNYPGTKANYCCADSINSFVIDPDGNMYKCWNDVGSVEKKVGNVNDKKSMVHFNSVHLKYMLWSPFEHKECIECNILPLCMGGCPYEGQLHKKPDCEKWRYSLESILKLTCEKSITHAGEKTCGFNRKNDS